MKESIYAPLLRKLQGIEARSIRMSFADVEEILGRPLPASAYKFNAWWGNGSRHSQAKVWRGAGFEARVSLAKRSVRFHKPPN
jgi:hypothetical protein